MTLYFLVAVTIAGAVGLLLAPMLEPLVDELQRDFPEYPRPENRTAALIGLAVIACAAGLLWPVTLGYLVVQAARR